MCQSKQNSPQGMRKEYNRMYYLKHRDKIIKRSSEWNKNNSERYKEYNIQRYKKLYIYTSVNVVCSA